jgi:hypothetical protein
MSELASTALFVVFGVCAVTSATVLLRLLRQGPGEISNLRRKGFGVRAMLSGELPKPNTGSTIDVMEGLEFIAHQGQIGKVRQTRTISREIC